MMDIIEAERIRATWPWVFTCCETGRMFAHPPESKPGEEPFFFWATKMRPERFREVFGDVEPYQPTLR